MLMKLLANRVFRLCAAAVCVLCVAWGAAEIARAVVHSQPVWTVSHRDTAAAALPEDTAGLIELNAADAKALSTLPGIGPAIAARIVEYRELVGGFTNAYELLRVSGIGEKTFNAILPRLYVLPAEHGAAQETAGMAR